MVEDLKWWCVWRGIDWCTQNGDLGGCVQTVRHRRRREFIFRKWSSLKLCVPIPIDVPVPGVWRKCQHRQITCWQMQFRSVCFSKCLFFWSFCFFWSFFFWSVFFFKFFVFFWSFFEVFFNFEVFRFLCSFFFFLWIFFLWSFFLSLKFFSFFVFFFFVFFFFSKFFFLKFFFEVFFEVFFLKFFFFTFFFWSFFYSFFWSFFFEVFFLKFFLKFFFLSLFFEVFVKACPLLIARTRMQQAAIASVSAVAAARGLALCPWYHLAWVSVGTPVGPGQDTHGTLGPDQREGRGWPAHSLTQQYKVQYSSRTAQIRALLTRVCCVMTGRRNEEPIELMHEDFQVHVDSDWVGDLLAGMNTTGMIVRRSIEECVSMTSENKITFETNCETSEYFHLFINTEMLVIAAHTHVDYVDDGVSFLSQELQECWNTRVGIACSVQWVWRWNKSTIGWTWNERQARRHEYEIRMTTVWLHERSRCKPGASYQWGKSWFVNVMTDWKSNNSCILQDKKRCPRMNSSIQMRVAWNWHRLRDKEDVLKESSMKVGILTRIPWNAAHMSI